MCDRFYGAAFHGIRLLGPRISRPSSKFFRGKSAPRPPALFSVEDQLSTAISQSVSSSSDLKGSADRQSCGTADSFFAARSSNEWGDACSKLELIGADNLPPRIFAIH